MCMGLFTRERWSEGKKKQLIPYYRGPLSTIPEWHALGIGFYHGFSEDGTIPRKVFLDNQDVKYEPHMAKIGFPIGVAVKYALVGLAFKYGFTPYL